MFELTINGKVYNFNFGFGFMKELDPRVTKKIDGVHGAVKNMGVQYAVAGIIDGDVNDLADVLCAGNKGFDPRLTRNEIEAHIENSDTDITELFKDVLGFLKSANCTKNIVVNLEESIEAQKAKAGIQTE